MTTSSWTVTVDADRVILALKRVEGGIAEVVEQVAQELADQLSTEGGKVSSRLGAEWPVTGSGDERHVEAPEWWAHFLAGGTADHGPTSAPRMAFVVDGQSVFATHVVGIPATHFDDQAAHNTESRIDQIMHDIIERAV